MFRPIIVLVLFISIGFCYGECPSGEFEPGPNCAFEVICGLRSAHSAREHYCDCWCKPPLIRDSIAHTCVLPDDCPDYEYVDFPNQI